MLDETFAEAVAHKPIPWHARIRAAVASAVLSGKSHWSGHVVLGQRLRPFSFWHAANLDFIESPFITGVGSQDFTALYLAAKCCRLRYPDTIATCSHGPMGRLSQWWATFNHARRFSRTGIKTPANEIAKLRAYFTDYFTTGPIHAEKENSKPVKIPWYLYWVCLLVKHTGCTKAQAWNAPVSESQWWITGMAQAEGADVDVLSADDRADMRACGVEI